MPQTTLETIMAPAGTKISAEARVRELELALEERVKKYQKIEEQLMIAELQLDGIKTHITMRKELCALYGTDFDLKVRTSLSAVRSARDLFRNASRTKQWTITTRGGSNRHGLWHMQVVRNWDCPFCHEEWNAVRPNNREDLYNALLALEIHPDVAEAVADGAGYEELADL